MADDYDRPHYHHAGFNVINLDDTCDHVDCAGSNDARFVISLDEYRELVAAARDRHPTNHQHRGIDPAAYIASLPPYPADS